MQDEDDLKNDPAVLFPQTSLAKYAQTTLTELAKGAVTPLRFALFTSMTENEAIGHYVSGRLGAGAQLGEIAHFWEHLSDVALVALLPLGKPLADRTDRSAPSPAGPFAFRRRHSGLKSERTLT